MAEVGTHSLLKAAAKLSNMSGGDNTGKLSKSGVLADILVVLVAEDEARVDDDGDGTTVCSVGSTDRAASS